ncbi:hypothetical protein [Nostoc sp.]
MQLFGEFLLINSYEGLGHWGLGIGDWGLGDAERKFLFSEPFPPLHL